MQCGLRYLGLGTYAELRTGYLISGGMQCGLRWWVPGLSGEREILISRVMQCGLRYLGLGT